MPRLTSISTVVFPPSRRFPWPVEERRLRSRVRWRRFATALLALAFAAEALAAARPESRQEPTAEQDETLAEELGRALGMTPAEIEALGLSPDELQGLLAGFAEETVVVGSRAEPRTVTSSPVPVDVLSGADLGRQGAGDLKEQLRTVIPSFNVNTQPIGGASTVVRPATLRNLAPDHTLILVNGKRRHRSSIIDWHGGNGVAYGSQAPDISTIPAIALGQVEVLRDGAAAQYGSDAIAGVMNFQLKDAASGGSLELDTGLFGGGDGESYRLAGNVGLPLGATGFANLSLEYGESNGTNRAAPRSDAIALIAAGNTAIASEAPQIWGAPEVDDDLKLFGNFGYTTPAGVDLYAHANYASKRVTGGFFFRNPNRQRGIYSNDNGRTLLIGDALAAAGAGSAGCPTVAIVDDRADPAALQRVLDDPDCFSVREIYPGGYTPRMGGDAADASIVGGVRGATAGGLGWDVSGSLGVHESDLFAYDTVNASLGPASPTAFDIGGNRQRAIGLNADFSYAVTDAINVAAGAEWRDEQFRITQGDPASWAIGPYNGQGFFAGSHGIPGFGPLQVGEWSRHNVAAYGDVEANGAGGGWTLGGAVRAESFEDFGTTTNGKVSGRVGFVRGSVSTGFRAPTPGQRNGFNVGSWFDPSVGYLIVKAVIPPTSPVARLRGGAPLGPEKSLNYTAGVVLDAGAFTLTADWFRIEVSDRVGVTSIFTLTDTEVVDLLAEGVEFARDLRYFQFFTNAFGTTTQGIDVVATWTPLALRGNTVISGVFNHTNTDVTDNAKGLLNDRRLAEYAYALPRTRGNASVTQRLGPRMSLLGRVSWYGGWYDYDSGYAQAFVPAAGLEQGFFRGRPVVDLELSIDVGPGTTLAVGGQNAFDTYSEVTARAMSVGEKYSEYTPWGYSGGYYYVRLGHDWGR